MIPQGYKYTELGIIPQEWDVKQLGDVLEKLSNGLTYDVSNAEGFPVTRIETISTGEINYSKVGYIPNIEGYEHYRMCKGDILYSHINSLSQIGKVAYYDGNKELYHGMNLLLLRANNKVISEYLYYYLLTEQAKHIAQTIAKPAVNQASISTSDLRKIKLPVPPIEEQRKIAEVLGVWDKAIELQAKIIDKLELRKRALMQRLLSGRYRLPGFSAPWQKIKLGEISHIQTGKRNGDEQILNGLYPFFVRSNIVARINTYSFDGEAILVPGEGGIGNIFHYIIGKFDYHQRVYKISNFAETICGKYVFYYMQQYFRHQALSFTVKATVDSLRLPTFECFNINMPSIVEQRKIVDVLANADKELELAKAKLAAYRTQKRGLMQQLLTGKKRVKP